MPIVRVKNRANILIAMEHINLEIKNLFYLRYQKTLKHFYVPADIVKTNLTATGHTNLETL
jgi:hypothetical protein